MRRFPTLLRASLALAAIALLQGASSTSAEPPPEHDALYDELSQRVTAFEGQLDDDWDGTVGSGQFATSLSAANGNKAVGLLTANTWNGSMLMLDEFEEMGVEVIKLEVHYPVFTPAFHSWLAAHPPPGMPTYTATVPNFIGTPASFYNRLVDEIRGRGLGLWIEHGTIFPEYSPTPPGAYFADMRTAGIAATRIRYTDERSAEAALVVSQLEPEHYTILEEPDTMNMNFGYFAGGVPLFDADGWLGYVQAAAAEIEAAAPGSPTLLGAGSGTWDSFGYIQRFAPLPELDFIDLHVYPLATVGQDFLQNALDWADYVRSVDPGKQMTIGETWLYKASVQDLVDGVPYNTLFARDVWSFWEPLDLQFHDMMFKLMQEGDFTLVMPFWTQYYWANITWGDPTVTGMSGAELIIEAGQRAAQNLIAGTRTPLGDHFVELVALTKDADGDLVPNATDNCQWWANPGQSLPSWPVPLSDPDCDGFTSANENAVGSSKTAPCAANSGSNNEPPPDAWPVDFNDNQFVNTIDIGFFVPRLGSTSGGGAPYDIRYDLAFNGIINTIDVGRMVAFLGKGCSS